MGAKTGQKKTGMGWVSIFTAIAWAQSTVTAWHKTAKIPIENLPFFWFEDQGYKNPEKLHPLENAEGILERTKSEQEIPYILCIDLAKVSCWTQALVLCMPEVESNHITAKAKRV